ncbi:MAG: ribonuclease III [SAR202 cluster bacterium]|nr:ribonuclease III [SAR202 cluster bacterium]|tara:strand:+ start:64225 stop:64944 length:720 start_codon:yes stop_codon:yes gene_type:complete
MFNLKQIRKFQDIFGIKFNNQDLLVTALTHSSFINDFYQGNDKGIESNETLEFLGDSVIGMIVSKLIYDMFPKWEEGSLTKARALIVSGDNLAKLSNQFRLSNYIYLGKGEEKNGGRTRTSNLANAFEALIGALFIDQGYGVCFDVIKNAIKEDLIYLQKQSDADENFGNYKGILQEKLLSKKLELPIYKIISVTGPDHNPTFVVKVYINEECCGLGEGRTKLIAEQNAALNVLQESKI